MDRHLARWLNDVEKIVFSTTLTLADWKNSRIADTDPVAVVNELRKTDSGAIRVYYDRKPT